MGRGGVKMFYLVRKNPYKNTKQRKILFRKFNHRLISSEVKLENNNSYKRIIEYVEVTHYGRQLVKRYR